ncbi:MAG TPA: NfeD family protein [Bacteroidales bacterium]|nr:NfeD family protein [Bacteroidales bacterium]
MKTRHFFPLLIGMSLQVVTLFAAPKAETIKPRILQVNLRKEVNSVSWMEIRKGLDYAVKQDFNAVLINMNTYGGEVLYADSIRTAILNATMPIYVFINNNAASAGALISIACDKIFMRTSATIGATTVVDASGAAAPDKYQSYMRGIIRATAEAQGKDTIISKGDTSITWRRNPKIAEAMVDPDIYIAGIVDTGKVLTFTANEALANGFCDGISESASALLTENLGYKDYDLEVFHLGGWDRLKGELMSNAFRAILIMLIIGGIWFELQAPGIGLPSLVSLVAAIFFFAPLYMDGLAQYWEIIVFVIGFILLFIEVFVIPGFGIAGIAGILAMLFGLTAALIDNATFEFSFAGFNSVAGPLLLVSLSITTAVLLSLWITSKIGSKNSLLQRVALTSVQNVSDGFVGIPEEITVMVGKIGIADTMLRPSGKVRIEEKMYDAMSEFGYIEKGESVQVTRSESGQIYVEKVK